MVPVGNDISVLEEAIIREISQIQVANQVTKSTVITEV